MNRHEDFPGLPSRAKEGLPKGSVYRSRAGREAYLDLYHAIVARQPGAVQTRSVATRFGRTQITLGGNAGGRPLIVLPGMSVAGPAMIEFFARLGRERCLIAPDLIGQPGLSEDRPFVPARDSYGLWLADVLDALALERPDMAAASFGASIALDLAAIAPERVGRLALLMPAGLTPKLPLLTLYSRLGASWMTYRHLPFPAVLPVLAAPLSRDMTPDNLEYLDLVIRHTAFWRHRPAGPFTPDDLKRYTTPVFLVLAGRDILFPIRPTRDNAHRSLAIAHEVILENSAHMPSAVDIAPALESIAEFLR